jgi:hypothetical protein
MYDDQGFGEFENIEPNHEKVHSQIITFRDRRTAEQVYISPSTLLSRSLSLIAYAFA